MWTNRTNWKSCAWILRKNKFQGGVLPLGSFHHILELDRDWSTALRVAEKPGALRNMAMFFAHSGDSWFWGLGLIILWGIGSPFWKQWAV